MKLPKSLLLQVEDENKNLNDVLKDHLDKYEGTDPIDDVEKIYKDKQEHKFVDNDASLQFKNK